MKDFNVWDINLIQFLDKAESHAAHLFNASKATIYVFDENNDLTHLNTADRSTTTTTRNDANISSSISSVAKTGTSEFHNSNDSNQQQLVVPLLLQESVIGIMELTMGTPHTNLDVKKVEHFAICVSTPICRYLDVKHERDSSLKSLEVS